MQRFREILVLAPPGPDTPRVVLRAAELAARNRARLTLFDVVPGLDARQRHVDHGDTSIDLQELLVEARRRELDELAATVMTAETRTVVEVGVRFVAVIDRVHEYEHDLVIGAPSRSSSRRRIADDSTMLHLLRKCPCPVWVDDPDGWGRNDVLVAIGPFLDDGGIGQLNRTLLELGTSLARIQHGELHIVHAWRLDGEHLLRNSKVRIPAGDIEALIDDERIAAEKAFGSLFDGIDVSELDPQLHLVHGRPSEVVDEVVSSVRPGVVIMGTLARSGLRGLIIGNTAERVLAHLEASVIAVKPPGFVSPVPRS